VTSPFIHLFNYHTNASVKSLLIGLFGLVGMLGIGSGPVIGRYFLDGLMPWYGVMVAVIGTGLTEAIQVGAGGLHIAAVVVVVILLDLFKQTMQTSLATSVLSIDAEARARLNSLLILSVTPHFFPVNLNHHANILFIVVLRRSYGNCGWDDCL
jgi:hypothetical protein